METITLDLSHAHLWDQSAVGAIDKVVLKFRRHGAAVNLIGVNEASATLLDKLALHNASEATDAMSGH